MNNNLDTLLAQLQAWGNSGGGPQANWQQFVPQWPSGGGAAPQGADPQTPSPQSAWGKLAALVAPQTTAQAMQGKGIFGMMGGPAGGSKGGARAAGSAPPSPETDHSLIMT